MDHKEIRIQITKNWLTALEYLIDTGRVKNYRQFEEKTGIRNQRISVIKKVEESDSQSNYINVEYIQIMNEMFGVSLEFLIYGTKPIIIPNDFQPLNNLVAESREPYNPILLEQKMMILEGRVKNLEKGMELCEKLYDGFKQ